MIKRFVKWILSFFEGKKLYKAKIVDNVPDKLEKYKIYIVQNDGYCWQAVMLCPCGCNKVLHMNLIKEYHPSWKFEINSKGIITLYPSINRVVECKSHFFIKKGAIEWCYNAFHFS